MAPTRSTATPSPAPGSAPSGIPTSMRRALKPSEDRTRPSERESSSSSSASNRSSNTSQTPRPAQRSGTQIQSQVRAAAGSTVPRGSALANKTMSSTSGDSPSSAAATRKTPARSAMASCTTTPSARRMMQSNTGHSSSDTSSSRAKLTKDEKTSASAATPRAPTAKKTVATSAARSRIAAGVMDEMDETENEPVKAYLRIRPQAHQGSGSGAQAAALYLELLSETEILVTPPSKRAGVLTEDAHYYKYHRVFAPELQVPNQPAVPALPVLEQQADFFKKTTLPLVKSLLSGSSGLIFTYGVTNSGKSYTVQGVPGEGGAGILPRTVDVIFNSIDGLQSESDLRPKGYSGVERMAASPTEDAAQGNMDSGINPYAFRSFARMLQKANSASQLFPADGLAQWEKEKCKIQVDRNWRYSIWVSYVEIYKEKIFDLLDVDPTDQSATGGATTTSARMSAHATNAGLTRSGSRFASSFSISNLASASSGHFSSDGRRQIAFDRAPLSLVKDPETGNKYVHGAREIRVRNAEEARSLIVRGGQNRAMFATATNSTSSRSHAIFTLRVVREHGSMKHGDRSDVTTARLSIVDLAGSERQANSKTEQPQLKEAGQINHGLVCLGQCLKALRKNQARAAASVQALHPIASARMEGDSAPSNGNGDAASEAPKRIARRRPSIVPFNHSKLTEVFSSFFTGDGQAVMILNLNPHTEYRENYPVLEMSACVQDVSTSVRTNPQLLVVHPSIARRAELFNHSQSNLAGGDTSRLSASPTKRMLPSSTTALANLAGARNKKMSNASVGTSTVALARKDASAQAQTQTQTHAQIRKQQQQPSSHQNKDLYDDEDVEITIVEGQGAEDEDEEGVDPFVAKLKEKYEEMYDLLCEAEERLATIESDVRAEMADEMTRRLQEMELAYSQRLLADAEDNENFVNRKIDLLLKANRGAGASSIRSSRMAPAETPRRKQERQDAEEVEATLAALQEEDSFVSQDEASESGADSSNSASTLLKPGPGAKPNKRLARMSLDREQNKQADSSLLSSDSFEGEDSHDAELDESRDEEEAEEETLDEEDEDEGGEGDSTEEEEEEEQEEFSISINETTDESFDATQESVESESSFEEAPRAARKSASASAGARKSGRATPAAHEGKTRAVTARNSAKKSDVPFKEQKQVSADASMSDTSLLMEEQASKGKKKKNLRKQAALDEDAMIQQLADSSLVDAMQRTTSSGHVAHRLR